jgi:hypothetical protein
MPAASPIASLTERVTDLEGRMGLVELSLEENTFELRANSRMTKQVHEMAERTEKNTVDIVNAVGMLGAAKRGSYATAKYVGAIGGAVVAVGGVCKLFGWW